jgi:hypothetical protein
MKKFLIATTALTSLSVPRAFAISQGILKTLAYKKQAGLGTPASGAGGQLLRRETATFSKKKDTYSANEMVSHQQHTGDTFGVGKTDGSINGVLSPATYKDLLASLLRKDLAATAAIAGASFTIAGAGPYTITRAAGSWLTDGVKIGDVGRITAGTYTGIARDINLLVTNVTALVLTVVVPNGKALSAQGPIASSTFTVIGKKSWTPVSGHTNDYYTFEEWFADLTRSRTWPDTQMQSADISIPATGNVSIGISVLGLSRTKGAAQVLTAPTAETSTAILAAANSYIMVNGAKTVLATSLSLKIDGQAQHGESVIGSNSISDIVKDSVKVSGTYTLVHDGETTSDLFDNETAVNIIAAVFVDNSDTSEFVTFVMPRVKVFGDDIDDGKKQLVSTYPFTAEINGTGGAALANLQTTLSMQDSAA